MILPRPMAAEYSEAEEVRRARGRTDAAMVNEVYAKVIAHNLCVLIQEEQELGIAPLFTPTPVPTAVSELAV